MSVVHRSLVCDRVRAQVSLGLDGELSQLENRMLASHLARCANCASFEEDLRAITAELRMAPLEQLEHPIVVRRPRRSIARLQIGIAAAFVVAMLGALVQVVAPETRQNEQTFAAPDRYATNQQLSREVNQIIADGRAFSRGQGEVFPL